MARTIFGASTNVEILLRFKRTGATQVRLLSTFFERFAFGHREFLSVRVTSGAILREAMALLGFGCSPALLYPPYWPLHTLGLFEAVSGNLRARGPASP